MMKKNVFVTVIAGALCLSLSLPVAAQAAEGSKAIFDQGVIISIKEINDAADLEKVAQEAKLIEDKLFIDKLCEGTVEEYFAKRGSSFIYDERVDSPAMGPGYEIGEPPLAVEPDEGLSDPIKYPDEELGDPLPPATEENSETDDGATAPEGNESEAVDDDDSDNESEESQPGVPTPTPAEEAPLLGGESERVAYLQIMRHYFGMMDKTLEEYAEYLRVEQGWDDEERLQYLFSLAFPDEYYTQPKPQPAPEDDLPAPDGLVGYVQSMRYYFGTDRSLEEYAQYLRTEQGWDDEERLQRILQLAFPDEYAPLPQPIPDDVLHVDGGESERVAYVQSMRYYFGTDRSLEEYAEYLRNEGWKDEEWLQHILSLAFPDEYYAAPEPQPVPDDELEIVY